MCSPSEGRDVPIGQWLNAHEGKRQPNILSDADDVCTHGLKVFLLKMLSYFPDCRPRITKVCKYIQDNMKIAGASASPQ